MSGGSVRLARLRDLVLLVVAASAAILATLLVVGHIWFRSLFFTAFGDKTLLFAAVAGLAAVFSGAGYVLAPPSGGAR